MNILKRLAAPAYRFVKRLYSSARLRKAVKNPPVKIVIGASSVYQEGWTPTEENFLNLLDERDWQRFFSEQPIDALIAEHVWEHLTEEQGLTAARNCYKYLKSGGYLRVAVPDGFHKDKDYIEMVKPGGYGNGADDHKVLWNYKTFSAMFEKAGFNVKLLEYFDENREFHFNEWNPEDGLVRRTKRYDVRNRDGSLTYTSLLLDAVKE